VTSSVTHTIEGTKASPPTAKDYLVATPVVMAATINLWKVQSLRELVPLDLTLLSFGITAILVLISATHSPRFSKHAVVLLALLACLLPGAIISSGSHPYAVQKSISLFTLVPLLILAGIQLIDTPQRRQAFIHVLGLIGLMVALALEAGGTATVASPDRIGLQDGNVIGLARVCSLSAICLALAKVRGVGRLATVAGAGICLHAASTTGSRGPILSAVLALIIVLFLKGRSRRATRAERIIPLALTAIVVWQVGPGSRLLTAYGSESDLVRMDLVGESFKIFAANPLGVGWGDFVLHMPLGLRLDGQGWNQYPHNVAAEAAVEGGVFAIIGLGAIVMVATHRLWRLQTSEAAASLALLIAAAAAALTSSDLTGNRTMWIFIGIGLAAGDRTAHGFTVFSRKPGSQVARRERLRQTARF